MIPFSPPRIDQKIIDAVTEALQSGWITTGPRTKEFEKQLAEYTGAKRVLCTSSATAGLELLLRWWGVGKGDEVIVPAYTYCATANVVEHCGATAIMVDAGPDFNLDLEEVRKKITAKTKAIIPVDIGGWPCDYDKLNALVNDETLKSLFKPSSDRQKKLDRILVLSDSAHSIGAEYNGRKQGTCCDVSVFSFHAVKNLTTAEGGAIALNLPESFSCDEIYSYLNTLSLHGQNKDAQTKMQQKGAWRYDVIEAGYKCNMTDIQAAIGLVELGRYASDTLPSRKRIFDLYSELLGQEEWAKIPLYENEERCSSFHVFMLRINGASEEQRDRIIQEIFEQEVAVNVHFQPLPLLSHFKNRGYRMADYPKAFQLYANEISLPVYYDLSEEQVKEVAAAVKKAVEKILIPA